jgi:hypothetical protein
VSNFLPRRDAMERSKKEQEIERREDREGIPGYGQPPEEVRTLHLDARQPEEAQEARPEGEGEDAHEATDPAPLD